MKIARVFPAKTSMSPTDPLAFFGPPTLEAIAAEPEAVHISVTFSWDIPKADDHFRAVMEMLRRQKRPAVFSGGLEPEYMTPWKAEQLMGIKPKRMYTAYDTLDDYEHLRAMAGMLTDAGYSRKSHGVHCYFLCGYREDSFEAAEGRAEQIMGLGFLPFAMLYRDEAGRRDPEWMKFQREWANAYIVGRKFADFWAGRCET